MYIHNSRTTSCKFWKTMTKFTFNKSSIHGSYKKPLLPLYLPELLIHSWVRKLFSSQQKACPGRYFIGHVIKFDSGEKTRRRAIKPDAGFRRVAEVVPPFGNVAIIEGTHLVGAAQLQLRTPERTRGRGWNARGILVLLEGPGIEGKRGSPEISVTSRASWNARVTLISRTFTRRRKMDGGIHRELKIVCVFDV